MTAQTGWRPRVVVCGTGFGRVYLAALRRPGMPFDLCGILARGSDRSRACASHYDVPLYTSPEQLPPIDIACVVLNSGLNGGRGAELARQLLTSGVHVLQEHPLHHTELVACLRAARQAGAVYHLNTNYVHVDPVRRFLAAARRLLAKQPPLFIDAVTSIPLLYTLFDILGRAVGRVSPWSLSAVDSGAGRFRVLQGSVGGVPLTLRVQNQLFPRERDNGALVGHRIAIGTDGGELLLVNAHGPVVWTPRFHMPADYREAVDVYGSTAAHLDLPAAILLTPPAVPSTRHLVGEAWPAAAARALRELRRAVLAREDPLPEGQYHLAISRLTTDASAALGPPDLPDLPGLTEPPILAATSLVTGAASVTGAAMATDASPAPDGPAPVRR